MQQKMGTQNNRKFPDEEKKVHNKYVAPLDVINYLLIALITEKHKKEAQKKGDKMMLVLLRRLAVTPLDHLLELLVEAVVEGLQSP